MQRRAQLLIALLALLWGNTAMAEPMRFTVGADGAINASGTITRDTYRDYIALLKAHPHIPATGHLVRLHSAGGNPMGASKLGALLRETGARVRIAAVVNEREQEGLCASACVLALAGGAQREAASGSLIGVHAIARSHANSVEQMPADEQARFESFFAGYYASMGIDPALQQLASATPHNAMRYLTPRELASLRLVTVPPGQHHTRHHAPLRLGSL